MICDGVATIFGPEGSCHVEAIVTQSRNIPMIAYVSSSPTMKLRQWKSQKNFFFAFRNVPTTKHQKFQPSLEPNRPTHKWVIISHDDKKEHNILRKQTFFFSLLMIVINLAIGFFIACCSSPSQVTKSVMSLLNYYGWNKFSIIYEEAWGKVAEALSMQAKTSNKTINHKRQVVDRHKCCENSMDCCRPGYWYNVSFCRSRESLRNLFFFLSRALRV